MTSSPSRTTWIGVLGVTLAALAVASGAKASAGEAGWKAGVARARITPEVPLWMAGYGSRDHVAEGTHHDLWIKVLALEAADGRRAVVVTSDLLGFPKGMYEEICAQLNRACGLERSQIMLTSSHTHSGPVLEGALYDVYPLDDRQRRLIAEYSAELEKTVVATVRKALSELSPAELFAGDGSTNFAVNRRNYRSKELPPLPERTEALEGPVDHSVPVLAVRSPGGQLRAVVFGYACHNTTLSFYQWCGDYAGFAQLALERSHPETVAMFYAGCGADQNPLPRRTVELCEQYGGMLSGAVLDVLGKPMTPIAPEVSTTFEFVELPFESTLSVEQLEAAARSTGRHQRRGQRLLEQLKRDGQLAASYPYPVQVWRLGSDRLWIVLGGEVVVDYALALKRQFGRRTWVAGYANDVMAYIPSRRVWEEGGYEAGAFDVYGLPTDRWASDIEERITAAVAGLVDRAK